MLLVHRYNDQYSSFEWIKKNYGLHLLGYLLQILLNSKFKQKKLKHT